MYPHRIDNSSISSNKSGFRQSDSYTNQLLSIMYQMYHSLDTALEVRSIFLDISKAFDKK